LKIDRCGRDDLPQRFPLRTGRFTAAEVTIYRRGGGRFTAALPAAEESDSPQRFQWAAAQRIGSFFPGRYHDPPSLHIYVIYRGTQAECGIRIRMAVSQEYVNGIFNT